MVSSWCLEVDAALTDLQRGDPFADMWSVLKKHLFAKYGAVVTECVQVNVIDLRGFYELVNPQFTAVYAARPDERRERHESMKH